MTLRERLEILEAAQNQRELTERLPDGTTVKRNFREVYTESVSSYSEEALILFANTAVYIMEPRESGDFTVLPMLLRPKQEEFLRRIFRAIDGGYPIHIDKTRDTGASWCICIALIWFSLFTRNFLCILGSITEDKIDKKGEKGTLFAKLDFIIEYLMIDTPWLYPQGYKDAQPHRTYMKIALPGTGAVLSGQAPNERFGRGDRQKCIVCDEFAHWEKQREAFAAMSQTSNCLIYISTPNGPGNLFAQLAHPRAGVKQSVERFTLSWEDDPSKNYWEANEDPEAPWYNDHAPGALIQPWLEQQKLRYAHDPVLMAQEIFIDYNRSLQGVIYPQIEKARIGKFKYNPDLDLYTAWDFGLTDHTAILWIQWNHLTGRHILIDILLMNGKSIYWYIPFLNSKLIQLGYEYDDGYTPEQERKIRSHEGFVYTGHFGDPSGRSQNPVTKQSAIMELRKRGIVVLSNFDMNDFASRISAARKRLPLFDIDEENCQEFLDAARSYKYKDINPDAETVTPNNKPVHNWASHPMTALEFYCVNETHSASHGRMQSNNYERTKNSLIHLPTPEEIEVFGSIDRYLRLKGKKQDHARRVNRGGTGY